MRTFTPEELRTMTIGKLEALSLEDQATYWEVIDAKCRDAAAAFIAGDYDLVGSNRRFELGE